jgi:hypothetical protein
MRDQEGPAIAPRYLGGRGRCCLAPLRSNGTGSKLFDQSVSAIVTSNV